MRKFMKRLVFVSLLVAVVFGLAVSAIIAQPEQGAPRKIVVFDYLFVNEPAQQALLERFGGTTIKPLPLINAWAVYLPAKVEAAVRVRAEVLRIDDDVVIKAIGQPAGRLARPKPPQPPPAEQLPWGVNRIDADLAWATSTGDGVKVGIVDTGIDLDHPDLMANIKGQVNCINPLKTGDDDNGHGTHVAGIVAAIDNDIGVIGVAPKADLYAVKVLSRTGSGYLSDVIEGLTWCINNGMQVINMSLGTSSDVQSFHDAIIAVDGAGIVQVAAAGNTGAGVIYPAKYDEVIAVSATDQADNLATWSSRGPEIDLAAPGVSIYSTYKGGSYTTLDGTSMAAPHVAGTVALMIAKGRDLSYIFATADDLGDPGQDPYYGYGLVDAEEAVTGTQTNP